MAQYYENFIIGNKYDSVLTTKLNLQNFVTVDDSLTTEAGMIKKINTKVASGNVETLAMGNGNTEDIVITNTTKPYEVEVVQGRFCYYDEEAMSDDTVIDAGIAALTEKMVNDFTAKAIAEYGNTELIVEGKFDFDHIVDALAKLNKEDETQFTMLISPDALAELRKNLKDDLKYSEAFARTGYIGSVCGVPVYVTKAFDKEIGKFGVIASKDAVTLFIKKNTEIEQHREPNLRKNEVYARSTFVVALTDATKVCALVEPSDDEEEGKA